MVDLIFKFLCGCLYLIGLPFNWTYQETSIYICIYACPVICIISAVISLFSCSIMTWWGRFRFSFNATLLLIYLQLTNVFWEHYFNDFAPEPFAQCVEDITEIANEMHISYEECNLWIYCVLFPMVVIFHLGQLLIVRIRHRNSSTEVSPN